MITRTLQTLLVLFASYAFAAKPNVIIILADDMGYADIGCFGSERAKTPHLDALAAEGLRMTDFHSNGAVCSPTRAALLTGRYQQRTGVTGVVAAAGARDAGLAPEEVTFAEVAKSAGYRTGLIGKWHVGYESKFHPNNQGFDEFRGFLAGNVDYHIHYDQSGKEDWWKQQELAPEEGYLTDLITQHGVDFIQRNKDNPFVLFLSHGAPHTPIQGRNDPPMYEPGKGKVGPRRAENGITPELEASFREMIEILDEGVGKIRKTLEDTGIAKNTLIFFTSDNGPSEMGSAGKWRGKKGSFFEGGHRVPAIAYWPNQIAAGGTSEETMMTADLLPTIAAISGAELPNDITIDGVNVLPQLTEGKPLTPRAMYWGGKTTSKIAVRHGDYKLHANNHFEKLKLYNLKSDPAEATDVSEENPELLSELLVLTKKWAADVYPPLTDKEIQERKEKEAKKLAKKKKQAGREKKQK